MFGDVWFGYRNLGILTIFGYPIPVLWPRPISVFIPEWEQNNNKFLLYNII